MRHVARTERDSFRMNRSTVRLKLGAHALGFPATCVVCGGPCDDKFVVKAWSKNVLPGADLSATRDFFVPMHGQHCHRRYVLLWWLGTYGALLIGLLAFALAVTAHFITHADYYGGPIFIAAMVIDIPMFIYVRTLLPFVIYQEFTLGVYEFEFSRSDYVDAFRSLNRALEISP